MTDEEKVKEESLKFNKGWLQGVAYLEFGHAIAYIVLAVLVFVLSNGAEIATNAFNVTEPIGGMSIEVVSCITGVISAIVSVLLGILILKSLKPGASKTALVVEIIAFASIFITGIYQFITPGFSWSLAISSFIDVITVGAAEYIRKNNK